MPEDVQVGTRPIDLHLKGFKAMKCTCRYGAWLSVEAHTKGLEGHKIYLIYELLANIMMAAALADGVTSI